MRGIGRWPIVGGALALLAASAVAAYVVIVRSPTLVEYLTGLDADPAAQLQPAPPRRGQREDRLPVLDPAAIAARQDQDELRRLGRPSIDAVWAARLHLPSPGEWIRQSQLPAPVDPNAPLAYAARQTTERPERDPFGIVDEAERRGTPPAIRESIPIPLPRPQQQAAAEEEEEEEEEEETIPVPLPRPRDIPRVPQVASPQTPPPGRPPVALVPAPAPAGQQQQQQVQTPPPAPQVRTAEGQQTPPRVQMAALPQGTDRDVGVPQRPPPTIMTPFGVPYVLQHDSVQTNCFPPPLVDLLRRIGQRFGRQPIITSGYRTRGRGGSLHRRCMAADIIVPGVSSSELARIARTIPGMGGVGQYCHPHMVHVDIGTPRDWRYGCGSFFALRDGSVVRGRVPN